MNTKTQNKLDYLQETKSLIKTALNEKGIAIADSDTFRSYADSIRNAELKSDDVRYVTFMNGEATLYVKPVATGDDCVDVAAKGLIYTPKKESTVDKVFTYAGWAATDGGAVNANVLKAVTEDKTVYAAYTESVRKYTVRFYDGTTLLKTEQITYGGSSSYEYNKEGYVFDGWNPSPENITADMDCYGAWTEKANFATSSWEDIVRICNAGKAESTFNLGDTRDIDLSLPDGTTLTVPMQIVGFDHDDLADGSGKAAISLISVPFIKASNFNDSSMAPGVKVGVISKYNAWGGSAGIYPYYRDKIYSYLPQDVKAIIKEVKKKYTTADYTIGEVNDMVWMPGISEVYSGYIDATIKEEGTTYAYFDSNDRRKKVGVDGAADGWMTRSIIKNNENWGRSIDSIGAYTVKASFGGKYVIGFCI